MESNDNQQALDTEKLTSKSLAKLLLETHCYFKEFKEYCINQKSSLEGMMDQLLNHVEKYSLQRVHVNTGYFPHLVPKEHHSMLHDQSSVRFQDLLISYSTMEGTKYVAGDKFFTEYPDILAFLEDISCIFAGGKLGIITIHVTSRGVNCVIQIYCKHLLYPSRVQVNLFHYSGEFSFALHGNETLDMLISKLTASTESEVQLSQTIEEFIQRDIFSLDGTDSMGEEKFFRKLSLTVKEKYRRRFQNVHGLPLKRRVPAYHPLMGIYNVGLKRANKLADSGFDTLEKIASTPVEILQEKTGIGVKTPEGIKKRVEAIVNQEVMFTDSLIPDSKHLQDNIVIDIETDMRQEEIWAISYIHKNEFTSFFLELPGNSSLEKQLLKDFIASIRKIAMTNVDPVLYCYAGSNFDFNVIMKRLEHYKMNSLQIFFKSLKKEDLIHILRSSVIFPIKGYKLKDISEFLDVPRKSPPSYDGKQACRDYYDTFTPKKESEKVIYQLVTKIDDDYQIPDKEEVKERLIRYNQEDCYLIVAIWETLQRAEKDPEILKKIGKDKIRLYFDGSALVEEKKAGAGWIITVSEKGKERKISGSKHLGDKTCNEAEWTALLEGLEQLLSEFKGTKLDIAIYGDSKLVIRQLNNVYRIQTLHLKVLANKVRKLIQKHHWTAHWIPREWNREVDSLAFAASNQK
ncbi:MAG: reverse transcriptase-like protein [Candidatus Hodarchaeales archaeon]